MMLFTVSKMTPGSKMSGTYSQGNPINGKRNRVQGSLLFSDSKRWRIAGFGTDKKFSLKNN